MNWRYHDYGIPPSFLRSQSLRRKPIAWLNLIVIGAALIGFVVWLETR